MRRPTLSPWILALMVGAGCSDDPQVPSVRADAAVDTNTVDVPADVALDAAPDAPADSPLDVALDRAEDARADATTDLAADLAADLATDTAGDVASDVAPDRATTDGASDASADASDGTMMAMVGPYPTGPYGNREGDVLANLPWEGYVNLTGGAVSTMRPYGPTSLQAMRETGRAYALVHLSEFY